MAIVKHGEADRYIAATSEKPPVFLVFGTDAGLVSERAERLLARLLEGNDDPLACLRLNGDDIAADPLKLLDEANAVSMFGASQIIFIRVGAKSIQDAVEGLLNGPAPASKVIIEAGPLRRDSPLRKLCEKSPMCAAIECYPDRANDLAALIDNQLQQEGLTIQREARETLVTLLGADRLSTRAEIEKLALYANGKGSVNLDDVNAAVADASALALDETIDAAFLGKVDELDEQAERVFSTYNSAEVLVSAGLRHAMQLHSACHLSANGEKQDNAIGKSFGYRIHFSRKPNLARQLSQWTTSNAMKAISTFSHVSLEVRQQPDLARNIAVRALWSIALLARNKARARN